MSPSLGGFALTASFNIGPALAGKSVVNPRISLVSVTSLPILQRHTRIVFYHYWRSFADNAEVGESYVSVLEKCLTYPFHSNDDTHKTGELLSCYGSDTWQAVRLVGLLLIMYLPGSRYHLLVSSGVHPTTWGEPTCVQSRSTCASPVLCVLKAYRCCFQLNVRRLDELCRKSERSKDQASYTVHIRPE